MVSALIVGLIDCIAQIKERQLSKMTNYTLLGEKDDYIYIHRHWNISTDIGFASGTQNLFKHKLHGGWRTTFDEKLVKPDLQEEINYWFENLNKPKIDHKGNAELLAKDQDHKHD